MSGDVRFQPNLLGFEELEHSAAMEGILQDAGDAVADTARPRAPRDTGVGADSIHAEVREVDGELVADVSWARDQFHMGFHEVGTEHDPPSPFLVPGLEATRI